MGGEKRASEIGLTAGGRFEAIHGPLIFGIHASKSPQQLNQSPNHSLQHLSHLW